MSTRKESLEYYHNKGEQDCAEGKGYNPPWGSLIHDVFGRSNDQIECDNAYDQGWKNAKSQKD